MTIPLQNNTGEKGAGTKDMEIFLDTANLEEIKRWQSYGVIDGVTTNPTIIFKDGVHDIEAGAKAIAAQIGDLPLSVEVTTNDMDEMVKQARVFASWADNIVVKIPVTNAAGEPALGVIYRLENEGIRVNCTACMSFGQAILASKAGATYVSLFYGRIADEGNDAYAVVLRTREWLDLWGYESKIIVGSMRGVIDVQTSAEAGAHVLTIPPSILAKTIDHKYTRFTVDQFIGDSQKTLEALKKTRKG